MVLDLAAHHSEGVVARVVVDVDPAEARGAAGRDPLLVGVVVHHDGGSRLTDTLFTAGENTQREGRSSGLRRRHERRDGHDCSSSEEIFQSLLDSLQRIV